MHSMRGAQVRGAAGGSQGKTCRRVRVTKQANIWIEHEGCCICGALLVPTPQGVQTCNRSLHANRCGTRMQTTHDAVAPWQALHLLSETPVRQLSQA